MNKFNKLWDVVETLRDPQNGCPWDLEQTAESLIPNFIEELYEVIEAIENKNVENIKEELGDLLLHILMQTRIAKEKGEFELDDVLEQISSKLIRRHPHIFAQSDDKEIQQSSPLEVKQNWEKIKHTEKSNKRKSILEGIPKAMPALIYSQRMQEKAASTGFDWENTEDVLDKIAEELEELKEAFANESKERQTEEAGDLLFAVVNFCRRSGIDSETALKKASEKFRNRFEYIEEYHKQKGKNIFNSSMEKLNELWEKTKE